MEMGVEEMARGLRAFVAFVEDPGLKPRPDGFGSCFGPEYPPSPDTFLWSCTFYELQLGSGFTGF